MPRVIIEIDMDDFDGEVEHTIEYTGEVKDSCKEKIGELVEEIEMVLSGFGDDE